MDQGLETESSAKTKNMGANKGEPGDDINEPLTSSKELLSNLNATIILAFVLVFIFRRSYKSTTPTINLIKGRLRTFGAWMLKFSILFSFMFSGCITMLCNRYNIKRRDIELAKTFEGSMMASFRGYSVDVAAVMIYALKISEILLVSSIFFLIALFVPQPSDAAEDSDENLSISQNANSTISTFSTMWAICRIPAHLYLDAYKTLFDQKLAVFIFELVSAVELFTAAFFTLIVRSKHSSLHTKKSKEDMNLLSVLLLFYAIFKHTVNLVEMPFALTEVHVQVLTSIQFSLQLGLYLILLSMFCPLKKTEHRTQKARSPETLKHYDECNSEVVLMPSIVEFDERPFRN